ncbi:hypothetical protein CL630_02340 [bacterium]|nr:hypothetical protein [bacterium]
MPKSLHSVVRAHAKRKGYEKVQFTNESGSFLNCGFNSRVGILVVIRGVRKKGYVCVREALNMYSVSSEYLE